MRLLIIQVLLDVMHHLITDLVVAPDAQQLLALGL